MSAPAIERHRALWRIAESLPVLLALREGPAGLSEVAGRVDGTPPLVWYHLGELLRLGFVYRGGEDAWRLTPGGRKVLRQPLRWLLGTTPS